MWNDEKGFVVELLTNNFTWTANTLGELYKSRWQVEIFLREIKQLLRIKTFIGTSENAVMIQIWTAMITVLLLKYLKQIAKHAWNLSNLVVFLRLNLFVKTDLQYWLDKPFEEPPETEPKTTQGGTQIRIKPTGSPIISISVWQKQLFRTVLKAEHCALGQTSAIHSFSTLQKDL